MAVDLESIRKRVQELSGQRRTSNIQMWKPTAGEFKVRGVPWKTTSLKNGLPLEERWFYYLGNERGMLTPHQFGKPDPIQDMIRSLYSSGKPEDRVLAKKLQPKMRAYMAVIVRGQEDKGVQVWSFGKMVYQRLLGFFTEEDIGDILDPNSGFDLKVVMTQAPGKQFMDTAVDPARRPSKLHDDEETVKKWLEAVPNIDDMWKQKSTQEVETALNNWLNGGAQGDEPVNGGSDGTTRGEQPVDQLTKFTEELKSADKPKKEPKAEASTTAKADLDAAFDELMKAD